MELLYTALSTAHDQPLSKSKIIKFRHYESILLTFLLIALVFFLIFQNMQLNQKIINRESMQAMMEQMLQQKFGMIIKQIQDLKKIIYEQNVKILQKQNQNKNIILTMSKQLGLPFYEMKDLIYEQQQYKQQQVVIKNVNANKHIYQMIQFDRNPIISQHKLNQSIKDNFYDLQDQQQNDINDEQQDQDLTNQEQNEKTCNYLDYLAFRDAQDEYMNDEVENNEKSYKNKNINSREKYNFSSFPKINHSINYLQQNYENQMKFFGHVVLIIGFIYGVLMFISFVIKKSKFHISFQILKGVKSKNNADSKKKIYKS